MNAQNKPVEMVEIARQTEQLQTRFILAQLEHITLVFPSTTVAEIFIVERSQTLALPFYNPVLLGIIHHSGQIIPLISLRQAMGFPVGLSVEVLTVIRLGDAAEELADIGLVVDKTLGMRSSNQLPPDLFRKDIPNLASKSKMQLFEPAILASHLWQPRRWQS